MRMLLLALELIPVYIVVASVFAYLLYYYLACVRETKIFCEADSPIEKILADCSSLKKYHPHVFLVNRHLQTIGSKFFRRASKLIYHREPITLSDDGELCLDWSCNYSEIPSDSEVPIAIVLHGLVGSSNSPYMRHCATYFASKGWNVAVLNARGAGTTRLKTARVYHAAQTNDVREVANLMRSRYPNAPLVAISFSLGANILTKYLGEEGSETPFDAAVSVCNVFDFNACSKYSAENLSCRFYNNFLAKDMRQYVHRHREVLSEAVDVEGVAKARIMEEIDRLCIVKIFGFESPADYYQQACCIPYVTKVKIPMLFLNSLDDPVMPPHKHAKVIPIESVSQNSNIAFALTHRGGHIGFLGGSKFWNESWGDRVCLEFLSAALKVQRSRQSSMTEKPEISLEDVSPLLTMHV
eukprot:TRINITY_DN5478_c0_g1_i1.p1 TRINITY_DN5478_c0_g1~~TRINITY_DN5478_c0_g1_i1.p1  ORF type:complete len:412 (+),score=55.38 TRINITY_DN5478_c0_g1_i1:111-1346(+)